MNTKMEVKIDNEWREVVRINVVPRHNGYWGEAYYALNSAIQDVRFYGKQLFGNTEIVGWVSTHDRLPPERQKVLIYKTDDKVEIAQFAHNLWWSIYEFDGIYELDEVQYWCQIPTLPNI